MASILVVEDDKSFNETLQDIFTSEGYLVDCVLDSRSAIELSYENQYDLFVFDVNLPYENGFELLGELRKSGDDTPCIFLTSRSDKASLKEGFLTGADDYMQKPVDIDELLLRVEALLRRRVRDGMVSIGEYSFDTTAKVLYKTLNNKNEVVEIGRKTAELLLLLLEHKNAVVSSEQIMQRLWSSSEEVSLGSLRVYVTRLSKHFPNHIQNIRGVGYKMSLV